MIEKLKDALKRTVRMVYLPFKLFFSPFIKLFWAASNYTGKGAEIVKAIPVVIMAVLIFYPAWSLPLFIWLSLIYGPPLSYILYTLWAGQIVILAIAVAYIDYMRKRKEET